MLALCRKQVTLKRVLRCSIVRHLIEFRSARADFDLFPTLDRLGTIGLKLAQCVSQGLNLVLPLYWDPHRIDPLVPNQSNAAKPMLETLKLIE